MRDLGRILVGCMLLAVALPGRPQLPPQPARLIIQSNPANAAITVNGKKIGQRTNATLIVSPGTYSVAVGDAGTAPSCSASSAKVSSGQTVTWVCSGNQWTESPKH